MGDGMFPLGAPGQQQPGMFAIGQPGQAPNLNQFYQQSPFTQGIQQMAGNLFQQGQSGFTQPFDRQRIEDAALQHAKADLDPYYAQATKDFEQQMANQGVDIGSQRYQREKELFLKGRDNAYNDARFKAMTYGGEEQSRYYDNMQKLLNPAAQFAGIESQENIAKAGQAADIYGINKQAETAGLDRTSREQIAQNQLTSNEKIATERNALDKALSEGRISFETWQTNENNRAAKELEDIRSANSTQLAQMEADANKERQQLQQEWQAAQNTQDRAAQARIASRANKNAIKIAQIQSRRSGHGGSGNDPYANGGFNVEDDLAVATR